MNKTKRPEAQNPLILRSHRIMEAFAKSDDERQFFLDKVEGFLLYIDLDKSQQELDAFANERLEYPDQYCLIPKMTFYETKKLMENFVTEKVYDIDTKEKLLDIIQSKEAREHFLEFVFDHHVEYEKWQQFYQERSRIQIIEWLRSNHFHFVFEEDLDMPKMVLEKVKQSLFEIKAPKDIATARAALIAKAKTYYSNEALNPRPKRGRPPKQIVKLEVEQQVSSDWYTSVSAAARPFLFTPEITGVGGLSFSSKFDSSLEALHPCNVTDEQEQSLEEKLLALRALSSHWVAEKQSDWNNSDDRLDDEEEEDEPLQSNGKGKGKPAVKPIAKAAVKADAKPAAKKAAAKPDVKAVTKSASTPTFKKAAANNGAKAQQATTATSKKAAPAKVSATKPVAAPIGNKSASGKNKPVVATKKR